MFENLVEGFYAPAVSLYYGSRVRRRSDGPGCARVLGDGAAITSLSLFSR